MPNYSTVTDLEEESMTECMPKSHRRPRYREQRRKLEDLARLGIETPFQKSSRRERRPFTDQEDRQILAGYGMYGSAWTRIQKDPRFHLQSRRPTDLRDRFRNKYTGKARSGNGRTARIVAPDCHHRYLSGKDLPVTNQMPSACLMPSSCKASHPKQAAPSDIDTVNSSGRLPHSANDQFDHFGESSLDAAYILPFTQSFDWANNSMNGPFSAAVGDMTTSRLLLDESWIDSAVKEKQSFTDINSILTSEADVQPHHSSFLGMLVSDDHLPISGSETLFA